MPEYLEENRYLFVKSGLGENELLLESFTGTEAVSGLFSFQLELLSENGKIRFEDVLGKAIAFGVSEDDGEPERHIHGIVTAFTQLPAQRRLARYRAHVAPKIWILTRQQSSRIFQDQSVPDILMTIFSGFEVAWELHESYEKRTYCVQYRETDFAFASRLMEEEGIYYFFRHSAESHTLVVADTPVSHHDVPGGPDLLYDDVAGGVREERRISAWMKTQAWGSGKNSVRDYSYGTPTMPLKGEETVLATVQAGKVTHKLKVGGNDQFEVYDYPGGFASRSQGGKTGLSQDASKAAVLGIQRIEASALIIHGESNLSCLIPGYRFNLTGHGDADGKYLLTSVTHAAIEGGFHSEAEAETKQYSNVFECIPLSLPYRPQAVTPKPSVRGCQTAVVVGPSGEEIYTDAEGRVKVQFHWDRESSGGAGSSCWVRVASFWAGQGWGAIHIPRVGQEVVVDFLEGDPDCPIIVGSVYNAQNACPYALPDNKTQSGIRSRSAKGGSHANYNEIRLEDMKGSEEILIHAEKDLKTEVEHDEIRQVDHDRTTTVGNDETCKVSHNRTTTVGNDETITVTHNQSSTVGVDRTTKIAASDSTTIGSNQTLKVGGSRSETVGGSRTQTVAAQDTTTVGSARSVTVAGSDKLTVAGSINITASGVVITAPMITLNAAMVQVSGVLQCTTLIATSVVSSAYTPGAGNMI